MYIKSSVAGLLNINLNNLRVSANEQYLSSGEYGGHLHIF